MKHKVLLIVLASIAVVILIAAAIASPIAKSYLNSHGEELLGRQVYVEGLKVNIFTGNVEAENLNIKEKDGATNFIHIDRLGVGVKLFKLIGKKFIIDHLILAGPDIKIYQNNSDFSFDDIIAHFSSKDEVPEEEKEPSSWDLGIYDIHIDSGQILYRDQVIGAEWHPKDLNVYIPGVYFAGGKSTDVGLVLNFTRGGFLETRLAYDMAVKTYSLTMSLRELTLENILPYLQQYLNLDDMKGGFSADLSVSGNTDHILAFDASGSVYATKVTSVCENTHLASIDSVYLGVERLNLNKNLFKVKSMYLNHLSADYTIYKDGTNTISHLIKARDEDEQSEAVKKEQEEATVLDAGASDPVTFTVGDMRIANSEVRIHDLSALRRFDYDVSKITLLSKDFDIDSKRNQVNFAATMNSVGNVRVKWIGDMSSIKNHNITASCANIKLPDFTVYCEKFTAYPLTDGTFSFRSQNIINDGKLRGTNHIDIFQCKAGKKDKSIKPEMWLPLRLGIYILTDRDGHINIDIPVSGDIESPNFSYRKIIFKAIGNLLLKVITAPFSFLSGGKELTSIAFDSSAISFTSEQYADLDRLAQMLKDKPELKVTMDQKFNYEDAVQDMAESSLKIAYYKSTNPNPAAEADVKDAKLSMMDIEEAKDVKLSSKEVAAFADAKCAEKGIDTQGLNIQGKAKALYGDMAKRRVAMFASARSRAMKDYMLVKQELPAKSFAVDSLVIDSILTYKGKSQYNIITDMEGDDNGADAALSVQEAPAQEQK